MPRSHNAQRTLEEHVYQSPDGTALGCIPTFRAEIPCLIAEPSGCERQPGTIFALDGSRLVRRIGRLVEKGEIDPADLPRIIGIDFADALNDCTPWWHPAFRKEANDFGGGADAFFDTVVAPIAHAEGEEGGACTSAPPLALLGYSLGGLFCLHSLMRSDLFDTYLIASPSTWYPGFVNKLERTPIPKVPRVIIACGQDEGYDHPEPIQGTRQDTDRAVAALTEKLRTPPQVHIDDFDHHQGLTVRLKTLLAAY